MVPVTYREVSKTLTFGNVYPGSSFGSSPRGSPRAKKKYDFGARNCG